jgi:hypothetical protein
MANPTPLSTKKTRELGGFVKRLFRFNKKMAVAGLAVGLVMGVGGFAFAFFTSTGNGTGSANVGKSATLQISQNGAVYDSLIPANGYVQDQAFFSTINAFGNVVNLTSAGFLDNVVVAFRNWGCTVNQAVTLDLYNPGNYTTPIAEQTVTANFPGPQTSNCGAWPGPPPDVTNVTFFANQGKLNYVGTSVAFAISGLKGTSINVALSSSGNNLAVGSDAVGGEVLVNPADTGAGLNSDTGCSSTLTSGVLQTTNVWGCTTPANNGGAYGDAQGADIPAIEFNMLGSGTTPPLFPGQTEAISFTVHNTGSGPAMVNTVTPTLSGVTGAVDSNACDTSGWFTFGNSAINQEVPAGGSVTGTAYVSMSDTNSSQDVCQGADLGLSFTSN